jgi:hypothetical protein
VKRDSEPTDSTVSQRYLVIQQPAAINLLRQGYYIAYTQQSQAFYNLQYFFGNYNTKHQLFCQGKIQLTPKWNAAIISLPILVFIFEGHGKCQIVQHPVASGVP